MYGLSVILCTYNPEQHIFSRVLKAIGAATRPQQWKIECIIIDNNSNEPLHAQPYVQETLPFLPQARIVVETKQGLTWSRVRGMRESACEFLLFIDDDNEIAPDFFLQLTSTVIRHPDLGAFNPGVIQVEYNGKVDPWFIEKGKVHFQESNIPRTIWGNDSRTYRHWPFGTGLAVKKDIAFYYIAQIENGRFTLTDRNGNVLTSGGDGQLVASALELGFAVGRVRELKLNHLISTRKATLRYLVRQDYGIYFSNEIFMKECYPDQLRQLTTLQEFRKLVKLFFFDFFYFLVRSDLKKYAIAVASTVGTINGKRIASRKSIPFFLNLLEKRIINR